MKKKQYETPAMLKKDKRGKPNRYPTSAYIKQLIKSIPNLTTRCLASILYLTGARITEIVGRKQKSQTYEYPRGSGQKHTTTMKPVAGLMPTQLTLREHQGIKFYMFEGLPVLKRREVLNDRRVPVSPKDNDVVQIVLDYVRDRNPREPIFPFDRVRAWVRLSHAFGKKEKDKLDEFNFYCHYFRHVCMNLKVDEEGFEALQLQTFARWANIKHTTTYLEGSPAIIVDKLINNYKDSLLRKP